MLVYNFITQLYITIILHKLGEAQIYYIYNWHFSLNGEMNEFKKKPI